MACALLFRGAMLQPFAKLLAIAALVDLAACQALSPPGAVEIVSPSAGAETGQAVDIQIQLTEIHRGFDLFVMEEECLPPDAIATPSDSRHREAVGADGLVHLGWTFVPGPHHLCAQLAEVDGQALDVVDRVDFSVGAAAETSLEIKFASPLNDAAVQRSFDVQLEGKGDASQRYVLGFDAECPAPGTMAIAAASSTILEAGQDTAHLNLDTGYHTLCATLADSSGKVLQVQTSTIKIYAGY